MADTLDLPARPTTAKATMILFDNILQNFDWFKFLFIVT